MATMTKAEYQAFLMEKTRTGKVATVNAAGHPHVAPVWFVLDGDDIIFMTGEDTAKGKHLRRDPHLALCVDEEQPLYSFVIMQGTVSLSVDTAAMLPWSIKIADRYMGHEQAETYGRRNAVQGEMLVRFTPTKVIAQKDIAD